MSHPRRGCSTDYEDGTSDEDNVEKKYTFVKRGRRDTESSTTSSEHESSVGRDNYETYNDSTEGGRLYRMAEGKVVYFGKATLTTYENIPEGVTWETPFFKLEQTVLTLSIHANGLLLFTSPVSA